MSGYLTPPTIPGTTHCRVFRIPDSTEWLGTFMGALLPLTNPFSWKEFGAVTPDEAAYAALEMIWNAYADEAQTCAPGDAPYWDDADGDDATGNEIDSGFPWYENLGDFIVTAFLASAFSPGAAVEFITAVRNIRLAFRSRDYGAILQVLIDGIPVADVDTYSPTPSMTFLNIDLPEVMALDLPDPVTLRIVHTGTHNEDAIPTVDGYGMEIIRKNLRWEYSEVTMFRQNPENSCQLEQLIAGEWVLAFDYSLCFPPTMQLIFDAAIQIIIDAGAPPTAPDDGWATTDDITPEEAAQRVQALCYACRLTIDAACDLYVEAAQGDLTALTVVAAVLGLVAAIAAVIIFPNPALFPLIIAMAEAVIWIIVTFSALVTEEMVDDPDTRELMACIMYQHLLGRAVTLEAFQSSFADFDCGTSDQNAVAEMLNALFNSPQSPQMYVGFLAVLGGSTEAIIGGAEVDDCGCPEETWCYSFVGAELEANFTAIRGHWSAADNAFINDGQPLPYGVEIQLNSTMFIPLETEITNFYFVYYRSGGNTLNINDSDGVSYSNTTASTTGNWLLSGAANWGTEYPKSGHIIRPVMSISANGTNHQGTISEVRFQGTGVNPFGGCSNC